MCTTEPMALSLNLQRDLLKHHKHTTNISVSLLQKSCVFMLSLEQKCPSCNALKRSSTGKMKWEKVRNLLQRCEKRALLTTWTTGQCSAPLKWWLRAFEYQRIGQFTAERSLHPLGNVPQPFWMDESEHVMVMLHMICGDCNFKVFFQSHRLLLLFPVSSSLYHRKKRRSKKYPILLFKCLVSVHVLCECTMN